MRIVWVVPGPLDQRTGGYLYDRLIVERLRARADEVHVLVVGAAGHLTEPLAHARAEQLAREAAELRPDAVVGDALASETLGPLFVQLRGSTARALLVHHLTSWEGEALDGQARRAEEARALLESDAVIATSSRTASRIAAEFGRVADIVVPGADRLPRPPRASRGAADEPAPVVFLFVGNILPRKRLPLLLDALDDLAAPHAHLRVVGDPSRDADHARLVDARIARSAYLSRHVTRLGAVDDDALAAELGRADALVLPSSLEGYGMVLTEALRAGVPVLAASAWAPPELGAAPDLALLFDDQQGLLAHLRRFAFRPSLRARMSVAAEAYAPSLPTWGGASTAFREALRRASAATTGGRGPSSGRSS
ncbi:MAG: glycosyltransferase family 4 protein [Myxococcota bacterium]|nr:glycosyltransferase family 4 protein [Myxococcota bacterium]